MARSLIVIGLAIAGIGVLMAVLERAGIRLGQLPGDLTWRGRNTTVYFPLATSILASVALTLLFWLFGRR